MIAPFVTSLALLAPGAAAAADENAAVKACEGKQEGDGCVVNVPDQDDKGRLTYRSKEGSCTPSECCELDYSKGSPPDSVCGPCMACEGPPVAGAAQPEGAAKAGEPPRNPGTDPPASPGNEKRGCAVSLDRPVGGALALMLVLGLAIARQRPPALD